MLFSLLPFIIIAAPLAYTLISLWCGRSYFSRKKQPTSFFPPVTIIKPIKGMDAESYKNFASFCRQDYPDFQIVFAVASASDPAIAVIKKLMDELSSY